MGEGFTVGSTEIRQAWVRKATHEREGSLRKEIEVYEIEWLVQRTLLTVKCEAGRVRD